MYLYIMYRKKPGPDPRITTIGGLWRTKPDEIRNANWETILTRTASKLAAEA